MLTKLTVRNFKRFRRVEIDVGTPLESSILEKLRSKSRSIVKFEASGKYECWYHDGPSGSMYVNY